MVSTESSAQTGSIGRAKRSNTCHNPNQNVGISPFRLRTRSMTHQPLSLGQAIRLRRQSLGISLATLAVRVGCSKGYLSTIENDVRSSPPSENVLRRIERAMGMADGEIVRIANWHKTPLGIRNELGQLLSRMHTREAAARRFAELLRQAAIPPIQTADHTPHTDVQLDALEQHLTLDRAYESGELHRLLDMMASEHTRRADEMDASEGSPVPIALPTEVPLVNTVSAGYPTEFTDLGFPARGADEYVRVTDVADPDAFACRVVGDSMEPEYRQGDIVVFSPMAMAVGGTDCFVRLDSDHESTFKRVYFHTEPDGSEHVRLQPLNNAYPPRILPRERVIGVYAAVSVTRRLM